MKTRCPCCGASASLEVLITHDEARSLMVALAGISDELAKPRCAISACSARASAT